MKNFNRIINVLLAVSLVLGFTVFGQSSSKATAAGPRVAMVCSAGGLGDKSWNDAGYAGLKRVEKELKLEIKVVEPKDISEGEKYLTELARARYDLIYTLEYGHADILKKVAPQFPNTKFVIFNIEVDAPNVISVMFKEHEASYLAGALAAMITTDQSIKGININKQKIISFVGGIDSPGINKFFVGFEEGARAVDNDIKVLKAYANSFGDPAKGKEIALSQIDQGSDVVYHAAGGTGTGVIEAAKSKGVFAIGVDTDQDFMAKGIVLTSVMKRVDNALFDLTKQYITQKANVVNKLELGFKEKGVALSDMKYTKNLIKKSYLAKIEQMKLDIISGKIKVTDVSATK